MLENASLANPQSAIQKPESRPLSLSVGGIFRAYRWRILFTYALFNLENLLRLAQPFVLGWAINDLLASSYRGLALLVVQHTLQMGIGIARRMYDTRAFTRIYTDLATGVVVEQRRGDVETSRVAARSTLSREYVDFFERHVPIILRSSYSLVGAVVMLGLYDWMLVPFCLGLVLPALVLNLVYGRRTLVLSGKLHDEFEHEVDVISRSEPQEVRRHFDNLSKWRVKLSDSEAFNVGTMELFILGLMAAALVRVCTAPGVTAGDIFAVFRYVMMFVMALDSVPVLVQQISRLRDIARRMPVANAGGTEGPMAGGAGAGVAGRGLRGRFGRPGRGPNGPLAKGAVADQTPELRTAPAAANL